MSFNLNHFLLYLLFSLFMFTLMIKRSYQMCCIWHYFFISLFANLHHPQNIIVMVLGYFDPAFLGLSCFHVFVSSVHLC